MSATGPERAKPQWVPVGRIVGVFGIKGWVKVESYTEPREAILQYTEWHLDRPEGGAPRRVLAGRKHGRQVVASLEQVADRDMARGLMGATIAVQRSSLPELKPREYYRTDLIGLRVVNERGDVLGRVEAFMETPAHPVMVVRGEQEQHLVPVTSQHLRKVDLAAGEIRVHWMPAED